MCFGDPSVSTASLCRHMLLYRISTWMLFIWMQVLVLVCHVTKWAISSSGICLFQKFLYAFIWTSVHMQPLQRGLLCSLCFNTTCHHSSCLNYSSEHLLGIIFCRICLLLFSPMSQGLDYCCHLIGSEIITMNWMSVWIPRHLNHLCSPWENTF